MTNESIIEAVRSRVLVGDGAMGTELMKRGLSAGASPDLWNVERRDDVLAVIRSYREAGADTLITNTFGASRWKLAAFGLEERVAEINAAAVAIACEAAGHAAYVLGDIGPTGRFMEPLGTDPRDAFVEVYAEQATALAKAGADAVIFETFLALDELLAGIEGAKTAGLPIIASMSYTRDAAGTFHTIMGNDVPGSTNALEEAGAAVIAANCGTGPGDYIDIAKALSAATSLPVMVQPNAGMPRLVKGETAFPMGPDEMAGYVDAILDAGARIIGGCCGTTPEHIRAIREVVDARA